MFNSVKTMTDYVAKSTINYTLEDGSMYEYTIPVGVDLSELDSKHTYTLYMDKTNMRQAAKKIVDPTSGYEN
jgi:hypothetical protein